MKRYTKTELCERYEINKTTQGQTIQASTTTSRASAAALARFSLGARLDTHISHRVKEDKEPQETVLTTPDYYENLDNYLNQCFHEWEQWLNTAELRISQLAFKYHRPFHLTDWSKLKPPIASQHKEATTTL